MGGPREDDVVYPWFSLWENDSLVNIFGWMDLLRYCRNRFLE